MISILKYNQLK